MTKRYVAVLLGLILLFTSTIALAHPGRTDSRGGHTCRTNCTKWGLDYGEYHYHNGGGSRSGGSSSGSTNKSSATPAPQKTSAPKTSETKRVEPAYQKSDIMIYVNDQQIDFSHEPVIMDNTNLVPLRELAEGLGAKVSWDAKLGKIEVEKGSKRIVLTIGSKTILYNGVAETLSAAPKIIDGVTYVPAQVVARGLGAKVSYDKQTNSLKISL